MIKFICGATLLLAASLPCAAAIAPICDSKPHRAFDFWLGDWQVYKPDGSLAGFNSITKEHNSCVLHERYRTPTGYSGESLNIYDASRNVWHQSWVDNSGTLLLLEGNYGDGAMLLSGTVRNAEGQEVKHQIRWTAHADGSVRQHWQTRQGDDNWQTVFDGLYRKITQATE